MKHYISDMMSGISSEYEMTTPILVITICIHVCVQKNIKHICLEKKNNKQTHNN